MSVALLSGPPTGTDHARTEHEARPVGAGTSVSSWPYTAVGLLVLALSVVLVGRTTVVLAGLVLIGAGVVTANAAERPLYDPCQLALTANLALLVSFPFARLPQDRTTSYVVVLTTTAVAYSGLRGSRAPAPRGRALVACLFGVLGVVSALSPDAGAVKVVISVGATAFLTFLLAGRLDAGRLRSLAATIVALALAESLLAVAEPRLFPGHLWVTGQLDDEGLPVPLLNTLLPGLERSQGTLGHPLQLAILLLVGLTLLVRVLDDLPLRWRVTAGATLIVGLVFTGSRSDLVGALVILLIGRRASPRRLLNGVGTCVLAAGVLVSTGRLSAAPLTALVDSGSYVHRASAYDSFSKLIFTQAREQTFIGNGFLSTGRVFETGRLQTDGFRVVDNQFLLTLSQGGVFGLLLLLSLVVLAAVHCPPRLRLALGAVVLTMLVFDSLLSPPAAALTWLVLGLACARSAGAPR